MESTLSLEKPSLLSVNSASTASSDADSFIGDIWEGGVATGSTVEAVEERGRDCRAEESSICDAVFLLNGAISSDS